MSNIYKISFITLTLLFLFFLSFFLKDFRIDASSDSLVAQNDKDFKFFNYYQEIFPSKNNLIIAIKSKRQIDEKLLNEINLLSNKINNIEEVESVFNINKAPILLKNNASLIDLSKGNFDTILNSKIKIGEVLNEFAESPIYRDQIINNSKDITSIIIFLKQNDKIADLKNNKDNYINQRNYYKKKTEIDEDRNKLINKIRTIIKEGNKEYEYYLGGVEMISNDVISFVKSDILIFSLLVISLVIIILFIIFKKIKWVFVVLSSSIFAVYVMVCLVGFLNFEITAVSANFLSLMFILSISMNIHILNNFLQSDRNINETIKIMFWPCFYTFLTTVVAFLSLVLSDIKPIKDFGIVMIIALIVVLIVAFTFLPFMISMFSREKNINKLDYSILKKLIYLSIKFKNSILLLNFFLFIIAIYGVTKLNVENSFIKYFKKNTEIYQGMELIDTELGGTTPLDIILKFENENINNKEINTSNEFEDEDEFEIEEDFFSDDLFNNNNNNIWFSEKRISVIKNIHEYLEKRNEIGKVTSIYSLINVANKINKNNLSTFELSILYNEIPDEYKQDLIYPYLNINENMVKISARVKDSQNIKRAELIKEINIYANSFDGLKEIKVNGLLVLYNNMLSSLFSSQIKSLGFVLLAIFIMFIILFKSIKLSIVGIIPNIFAATFILGMIGLLKIPLDIMTITIAAISIGIAVDNTIHYLYRYKLNTSKNIDYRESINKSHLSVGKAVLTTSLAISLGFLTLCFSSFVPTIIFGLFTSLAMILAMIGVLITLPSLLNYLR